MARTEDGGAASAVRRVLPRSSQRRVCCSCAHAHRTLRSRRDCSFPTWSAEGDVPAGEGEGVLAETDGCLYVEANGQRTLPIWEEGRGFADATLLGSDGEPIAEVGELIHGGGYYSDRAHIEDLADERIPDRCVPEGTDRFAVIYDIDVGPFTR